jgi:dTDP-glucose 4,6-dehydratase
VYGSIEKGSFKENDVMTPRNPYSASKLGADRLAYSFFITYDLPVIITRSSNNFGPYQHPEKLIPLFITNLLRGQKVPLYGDGMNVRDWLYVIDNCEAIEFLMNKGKIGEAYNVSGGNEKTNIEITRLILKELGRDESSIEFVKDRPGHDRRYSLNDEKIRKLGWQPRFKFEESLKETIKWYKENKQWWESLVS